MTSHPLNAWNLQVGQMEPCIQTCSNAYTKHVCKKKLWFQMSHKVSFAGVVFTNMSKVTYNNYYENLSTCRKLEQVYG